MEALRGKTAKGAQVPAFVTGEQPMRVVLDNGNVPFLGDGKNAVHLASDPCVMHRHDSLGTGTNQGMELGFVQIQSVRANVGKDRHCSPKHESVNGGDEGERWEDHLV